MAPEEHNTIAVDGQSVDLRNRKLAALLAWLIPGAGHIYQASHAKGVCSLSASCRPGSSDSPWVAGTSSMRHGNRATNAGITFLQAGVGRRGPAGVVQADGCGVTPIPYGRTDRDYGRFGVASWPRPFGRWWKMMPTRFRPGMPVGCRLRNGDLVHGDCRSIEHPGDLRRLRRSAGRADQWSQAGGRAR